MVLGTADAAKWVSRQKNRLPQPRATISTSIAAGRCERPTAEAAERRLEAGVFAAFQTSDGGSVDFAEWVQPDFNVPAVECMKMCWSVYCCRTSFNVPG